MRTGSRTLLCNFASLRFTSLPLHTSFQYTFHFSFHFAFHFTFHFASLLTSLHPPRSCHCPAPRSPVRKGAVDPRLRTPVLDRGRRKNYAARHAPRGQLPAVAGSRPLAAHAGSCSSSAAGIVSPGSLSGKPPAGRAG